jgi:ribonuclease-3
MFRSKEKDSDEGRSSKKQRYRQLDHIQDIIKVNFKDKTLLNRALTHRSYINESSIRKSQNDNEKLEYLGDSVLALVVNEYLFNRYEDYTEGQLAKIKSAAVSEPTLAKAARSLHLGNYLLMGKGEESTGGKERTSILANAFEALIGAIYLDSGFKTCRKFILSILKKDIETIDSLTYLRDPKTTLQEYVQKKYRNRPDYNLITETGPDHQKLFCVELVINGKKIASGNGSSKRKAEKDAAMNALKKLENGDIQI